MSSSNLNDRQSRILEMLSADGEMKISELSQIFTVSEMTIRRDLEKMEQYGLVHRIFGGAIPAIGNDIALHEREGVMTAEKMRIGRRASERVTTGQAIFIDAGTTTLQIARHLRPGMDITVVTNAINVATELMEKHIPTIVIGGILREGTSSLVGPDAEEAIAKMAFDAVFLGASGVTTEHGFHNSNVFEAEVKRIAIEQASEVNIVLDHSKFGVRSLYSFAELHRVQRLYTDACYDERFLAACRKGNVEVVIS